MSKISYKLFDINNLTEKTKDLFVKQMFKLECGHYPIYGDLFKSSFEKQLLSDLKNNFKFLCVFSNDLLIGKAKVNIVENTFVLDHIFVKPNFRDKGFGKKLMIRVVGYAKKHKYKNIIFNVANPKMHTISKKIASRNLSRSSTKYKYSENVRGINHMSSVINMKKKPGK